MVDELELAVGFQQSGVRADAVDVHALDVFCGGDQGVGHRAGRKFDHQIVDGVAGAALDDVEGQDVGTHRTECDGQ